MGAELFNVGGWTDGRTDGQRDVMKLIVTFRNFTKAPKKAAFKKYVYVAILVALFSKTEVLFDV